MPTNVIAISVFGTKYSRTIIVINNEMRIASLHLAIQMGGGTDQRTTLIIQWRLYIL